MTSYASTEFEMGGIPRHSPPSNLHTLSSPPCCPFLVTQAHPRHPPRSARPYHQRFRLTVRLVIQGVTGHREKLES